MKIAIIGSNGYLGRKIASFLLNSNYEIEEFSSKPKENQYHLREILNREKEFSDIIFLLNSNNKKNQNQIKAMLLALRVTKSRLILFSTYSVYSLYKSNYVLNKINLEKISDSFENFIVIRLGYVYEASKNSYKPFILNPFKKDIYILPGANWFTGFIKIENLLKRIEEIIIDRKITNTQIDMIDCELSLKEFLIIKKYRGMIISINIVSFRYICIFYNILNKILPSSFQSIFALAYMEKKRSGLKEHKEYLRRIFIYNYFRINKNNIHHNIFYLRKMFNYKYLIDSNYPNISKKDLYLYHLRQNELLNTYQNSKSIF